MTKSEFQATCYHMYCLHWMMTRGYSLKDYRDALAEQFDEYSALNPSFPYGEDPLRKLGTLTKAKDGFDLLHDGFEDSGFSGSLYVCYGEFLDHEFRDPDYMKLLLSQVLNSRELWNFYEKNFSVLDVGDVSEQESPTEPKREKGGMGEMSKNTRIDYLYRDASNHKMRNHEILAGAFTQDDIAKISEVMDCEFFCPEQVGLPLERPDEYYTEDDHCLAELYPEDDITLTDEAPTISLTWRQLVENFNKVRETGWRPEDYIPGMAKEEEEEER